MKSLDFCHLPEEERNKASILKRFSENSYILELSRNEKQLVIEAVAKLPARKWRQPREKIFVQDIEIIRNITSGCSGLKYQDADLFHFSIPDFNIGSQYLWYAVDIIIDNTMLDTKISEVICNYQTVFNGLRPYLVGPQKYIKLPFWYSGEAVSTYIDLFIYENGDIWCIGADDNSYMGVSQQIRAGLKDFLVQAVKNNQTDGYDEYYETERKKKEWKANNVALEQEKRRKANVCQHCGAAFVTGLFGKKCSHCGKRKDY